MTQKIILNTIVERIALNVFVNDVDSRIIGHHAGVLCDSNWDRVASVHACNKHKREPNHLQK
jgi:hypothetical protein